MALHAQMDDQPVNGTSGGGVSTTQAVWLMVGNELVPAILAFIPLFATAYAVIKGIPVPEVLANMDFAIVAFYFGARQKMPITIGGK